MPRIAGLQLIKNEKGKTTHVKLSVKHYGKMLEDLIDAAEIEQARKGESIPWEEAKARIDKKFGFID